MTPRAEIGALAVDRIERALMLRPDGSLLGNRLPENSLLQERGGELADIVIVVHNEDAIAAADGRRLAVDRGGCRLIR